MNITEREKYFFYEKGGANNWFDTTLLFFKLRSPNKNAKKKKTFAPFLNRG